MNTNKITLTLAFLFFTFSSFDCRERQKIEKITFHYVDLEIETPFLVSCDNFENSFLDNFKSVVVTDSRKLKEFSNDLSHCNVSDSVKNIDVRVKVIVTYADKKSSVICMDKFNNLVLDNKSISTHQEDIILFIKGQITR